MTILNQENSILLVIDVQEKLLNAVFNKNLVLKKAGIIAKAAKLLEIPAIVTEQYPKGLGATVSDIFDVLSEKANVYEKCTFSALDNGGVFEELEQSKRKQAVVFGIETHICVNQTVNALIELGYEVFVVSDACGSRAEEEHKAGLHRMESNGAQIVTAEIALFEWLRSSQHPKFKEIQELVK